MAIDLTLVDRGDEANDGTGDSLRAAFGKLNDNDTALKTAIEAIDTSGGEWGEITGTLSDQTDLDTALDGKADTDHTHTLSDITDAGTAAASDTGDFATASHTHTLSDITDAGTAAASDTDDFAAATSAAVTISGDTTLTDAHLGKTLIYAGTDDITLTDGGTSDGFYCSVINASSKKVQFAADTGDTLVPSSATLHPAADGVSAASVYQDSGTLYVIAAELPIESFSFACSDESTDLTTGTGVVSYRMPYDFVVTEVRASVNTAPVGATVTVDINADGTSILSTKLTIDASEKTSETAATAAVISDSTLGDDSEITIDIDQVGSSTAGKGLKVTLLGYRA